jgi:hypothetical protein
MGLKSKVFLGAGSAQIQDYKITSENDQEIVVLANSHDLTSTYCCVSHSVRVLR